MNVLKTTTLIILGSLLTAPNLFADEQKCEAAKDLDLKNINSLYTSFKNKDDKNGYTPCR
jgi:hypothetical protein